MLKRAGVTPNACPISNAEVKVTPVRAALMPKNLDQVVKNLPSSSTSSDNNTNNKKLNKQFGQAEEQHFGRIPSQHFFNEVYRPSHLRAHPTILGRTIRIVTTLGKALFHDSSWGKFGMLKR